MTSPAAISAITFDCWGTLIHERDFSRSHEVRRSALASAIRTRGGTPRGSAVSAALDRAWHRHWEQWTSGRASGSAEIAAWALEPFGIIDSDSVAALAVSFAEAALESEIVVLDGAHEVLARLRRAGVRRGLICDTGLTPGRVVRRLLDQAGLLALLEVQIFSDEVGRPKPAAAPFEAALSSLGVAAARSLHVGDLRRTDVLGARAMGMATVRIAAHHDDRSALPEADFVVSSHAELQQVLDPLVR